jgi:hypothetical protein
MNPDVPAWLDLDLIVSPELRERLRAMTVKLKEIEPTVRALARESVAIRDACRESFYAAVVPDGLEDLLDELSGFDAMFEAWLRLTGYGCDVTECVPI